jgi:uncharacterized protein (DUF934 family)
MRRILRRHEIVPDDWRHLGEDASDVDALIIPFSELRAGASSWRDWRGRLGVRIAPAEAVEEIVGELPRLSLVAVEFPNVGDGRGFTHGRLLRQRYQFKGELRAVGGGVKQDRIFLLARCGFDSFELPPGEKEEEALQALQRYNVAYQSGDPSVTILKQRFFSVG